MDDKKPENVAERFIREGRMQFYSIRKTRLSYFLEFLFSYDVQWKNGILVWSDRSASKEKNQITEDGYKSLKNDCEIPVSWPAYISSSPLKNIPNDAHEDWLTELSMFVYQINKIDDEAFSQYITGYYRLQGYTEEYRKQYTESAINGLKLVKDFIKEYEVYERINSIRKSRDKNETPIEIKVGTKVRHCSGTSTSTVLEDKLTFNGSKEEVVKLDKPIRGSLYWNKSQLVGVK